jgi:WD40 repeat protein
MLSVAIASAAVAARGGVVSADPLADMPDASHVAMTVVSADCRNVAMIVDNAPGKSTLFLNGKTVASDLDISLAAISPDGKRLAYVVRDSPDNWHAVVDGIASEAYDVRETFFTPDASGKVVEMLGPVTKFAMRINPFTFSPDSKHIAYVAKKAGRVFVVRDGVAGSLHHDLDDRLGGNAHYLLFSPDSQHLAYAALEEGVGPIVDEKIPITDGNLDSIRDLSFSPDSKRMAFNSTPNGPGGVRQKVHFFVDGKDVGNADAGTGPVFSDDSLHVAFVAITIGSIEGDAYDTMRLVVDGHEGPPTLIFGGPEFTHPSQLTFGRARVGGDHSTTAPSGPAVDRELVDLRTRFWTQYQATDIYVTAEKERDLALAAYFAADPSRRGGLATPAQNQTTNDDFASAKVRLDAASQALEKLKTDFDASLPNNPDFLAAEAKLKTDRAAFIANLNGLQLAFVLQTIMGASGRATSSSRVEVNLVGGKTVRDVSDLSFSPDGRHVAYAAGSFVAERNRAATGWMTALDEKEGAVYEKVLRPLFSLDSKHLAYAALEHGHWLMMIDGHDLAGYEPVVSQVGDPDDTENDVFCTPYRFDSDGNLIFLGSSGGKIFRVTWKPDGSLSAATRP